MTSYSYDQIIACANGTLEPGLPKLPLPPMLMFDRIDECDRNEGAGPKGIIRASLDIHRDLWFFACHFKGDPVMPGCLQLDALWQLLGFFQGYCGARGLGRALKVGNVRMIGQIRPTAKKVTFGVTVTQMRISPKSSLAIGNGGVYCDDEMVCEAEDLRVGVFPAET